MLKQLCFFSCTFYMYVFFLFIFVFIKVYLYVCVHVCSVCMYAIYLQKNNFKSIKIFKIYFNKCTSTNKISCFWIHKKICKKYITKNKVKIQMYKTDISFT